jgi:hypothetical protein
MLLLLLLPCPAQIMKGEGEKIQTAGRVLVLLFDTIRRKIKSERERRQRKEKTQRTHPTQQAAA